MLRPDYHYYRMAEGGDALVAYCCFGPDARVAGRDYSSEALDIGLMVRPDLNGLGRGGQFAAAVLEFAQRVFPERVWRVTIAEFNQRAQRVWQKSGFHQVQTFARRGDGLAFGIWVKDGAAGCPENGSIDGAHAASHALPRAYWYARRCLAGQAHHRR